MAPRPAVRARHELDKEPLLRARATAVVGRELGRAVDEEDGGGPRGAAADREVLVRGERLVRPRVEVKLAALAPHKHVRLRRPRGTTTSPLALPLHPSGRL